MGARPSFFVRALKPGTPNSGTLNRNQEPEPGTVNQEPGTISLRQPADESVG
jgi:hypothetical protein